MADPTDDFFAGYPPTVTEISRELRAIVKREMPEAIEELFARQNHVGYSFTRSRRDLIAYICPMQEYVRFGFMWGGYLPDPDHLLVGEGKRLRHVKVRSVEAAEDPALARLAEAAWADAVARMKRG